MPRGAASSIFVIQWVKDMKGFLSFSLGEDWSVSFPFELLVNWPIIVS
jgi:hypothetical protein